MAAVLGASYPWNWKPHLWRDEWNGEFRAAVSVERFTGAGWAVCARPADSGWGARDRESAFEALLASWGGRASWTEDVTFWSGKVVSLPFPPASSTEELCLRLSVMEAG